MTLSDIPSEIKYVEKNYVKETVFYEFNLIV